jgi:thiol-disulfide isomerase/thioredoxin
MDKSAKVTQSFFVGQDGIAKRAALTAESKVKQGEKVQVITTASNVVVNGNSVPDLFAFKAPSNAKEIDYQDLIANKWFLDLDEAKLVASRTNKNIFIDFMATWCGPCKQMEREVFVTDEFKAMGKKLVFCKIDIDMNPALAEKYGVTAIPNMFVIRPDGSVVGSILGSMPLTAFMQELEKLTSSNK